MISVFVLYGFTGAHQNKFKAIGTSKIFKAILQELEYFGDIPHFIMGDMNGEPDDFPMLKILLDGHHWTDVGSVADTWGQPCCAPTCFAGNTNAPSRRDYIFARPN